jgi:hypothetical protein
MLSALEVKIVNTWILIEEVPRWLGIRDTGARL